MYCISSGARAVALKWYGNVSWWRVLIVHCPCNGLPLLHYLQGYSISISYKVDQLPDVTMLLICFLAFWSALQLKVLRSFLFFCSSRCSRQLLSWLQSCPSLPPPLNFFLHFFFLHFKKKVLFVSYLKLLLIVCANH